MSTPFRQQNNLSTQTSQNVSISLAPSNSQWLTPINNNTSNNNGAVNLNLSLNIPPNFLSQNPTTPISSQFYSHQNGRESGVTRSDFASPGNIHANNISYSNPPQPQQTINININMGNNPPINLNLLNNNLSSHFPTSNIFSSPSSNISVPNNVINYPSLNYEQLALSSNQEPLPNISESHEFTTYTDLMMSVNSLRTSIPGDNQEIPVGVPCSRQSVLNSSFFQRQASVAAQGIQHRNHIISQRNSNVSLIRTSTGHFPYENNDFSTSGSSTMNPMNGYPHPRSEAEPLRQQSFQGPPGFFPLPEHSRPQSQTEDGNRRSDNPQRQGERQSTRRCRCEGQLKEGPYKCAKCGVIFSCVHRYAAHAQSHYRHESPEETKKRRGGKYKKRELHIAKTNAGITVMPGPGPIKDPSIGTSSNNRTTPYIKEEVESD